MYPFTTGSLFDLNTLTEREAHPVQEVISTDGSRSRDTRTRDPSVDIASLLSKLKQVYRIRPAYPRAKLGFITIIYREWIGRRWYAN